MPDKVNKKKEIKTNSDVFEIYLGTFNDDVFTWYSIKKMKDATEAYKEFKKYVNTQLKYTDEELKKVWDTGRLDIELRQGNKLLNWVGIYSREVKNLSKEEEKEAEEAKIKKDSQKIFINREDKIIELELDGDVLDNFAFEYAERNDLNYNNLDFADILPDEAYEEFYNEYLPELIEDELIMDPRIEMVDFMSANPDWKIYCEDVIYPAKVIIKEEE